MPSLAGCHLQVFANKQRNTYNDVQTCGKLCSDVILYNGLDMEADLFEVYFFVLIFIDPNQYTKMQSSKITDLARLILWAKINLEHLHCCP